MSIVSLSNCCWWSWLEIIDSLLEMIISNWLCTAHWYLNPKDRKLLFKEQGWYDIITKTVTTTMIVNPKRSTLFFTTLFFVGERWGRWRKNSLDVEEEAVITFIFSSVHLVIGEFLFAYLEWEFADPAASAKCRVFDFVCWSNSPACVPNFSFVSFPILVRVKWHDNQLHLSFHFIIYKFFCTF